MDYRQRYHLHTIILLIHTHTHMYGKAMRLGAEGSYLSDSERTSRSVRGVSWGDGE